MKHDNTPGMRCQDRYQIRRIDQCQTNTLTQADRNQRRDRLPRLGHFAPSAYRATIGQLAQQIGTLTLAQIVPEQRPNPT